MEWIRTAFHIIFIENGLILAILLLSIAVVSNSLVISTQKKKWRFLKTHELFGKSKHQNNKLFK